MPDDATTANGASARDAICHVFRWWPCTADGRGSHMSYTDAQAWVAEKPGERWVELVPA